MSHQGFPSVPSPLFHCATLGEGFNVIFSFRRTLLRPSKTFMGSSEAVHVHIPVHVVDAWIHFCLFNNQLKVRELSAPKPNMKIKQHHWKIFLNEWNAEG